MQDTSILLKHMRLELEELSSENKSLRESDIRQIVDVHADFHQARYQVVFDDDFRTEIVRQLETEFNVTVIPEFDVSNGEGHIPWLNELRRDIPWNFWDRYRSYMVEDEGRPSRIFDQTVGDVTDKILGYLENPKRPGPWERRGLVAGQVQSGKTSNYIGLVNKAIDSGYKLVIIMAGAHDSLRSQTQQRVNEGVLGFNTLESFYESGNSPRIGVGLKRGPRLFINSTTTVDRKGDFSLAVAKQAFQSLGSDPTVLVVKKNASILRNVYKWATGLTHEINADTGKKIVKGLPILILDDEADYASIDTKTGPDSTDEEADPSTINKLIRQILDTFEQSAYVAYTATPFANIYIDPTASSLEVGRDLFPEHFIVRLPEPSNYSGPIKFFGLDEDADLNIESVEPMPMLREIRDYEPWIADGHKKTDIPTTELPETLKTAIQSFVLADSLKMFRQLKTSHSSMLIHVTRFNDVQAAVREQVFGYLETLRRSALFEDLTDPDSAMSMLRELYETDFRGTTEAMMSNADWAADCREMGSWEDLEPFVLTSLKRIVVQIVNGSVTDSLMYSEHPNGLSVIAIGGDKLSRGLTLEGLMVSYYLRASKMYDTLMQMGRWFGYRPGYLDLCRIYTTPRLILWYQRITSAAAKLYREFEIMSQLNKLPRDFGLRVQKHPDGLLVTSRNKSRHSVDMKVSFAGTSCETLIFETDDETRKNNWDALEQIAIAAGLTEESDGGRMIARGVPSSTVINFLQSYSASRDAGRGLPGPIIEFINKCNELPVAELDSWTILLASKDSNYGDGKVSVWPLVDTNVGLYRRAEFPTAQEQGSKGRRVKTIKRLVSSGDELIPIRKDSSEWAQALAWAVDRYDDGAGKAGTKRPTRPTALAERFTRSTSEGYLMLYPIDPVSLDSPEDSTPFVGFAASFPSSEIAPSVDYKVNSVYWDQLFEEAETDNG